MIPFWNVFKSKTLTKDVSEYSTPCCNMIACDGEGREGVVAQKQTLNANACRVELFLRS